MNYPKPKSIGESPAKIGLFSKREAASWIIEGYSHIHSSILGLRDSLANLTMASLQSETVPNYPWEKETLLTQILLGSSKERKKTIERILSELKIKGTTTMGDRIWTSLEELLTNSIFHAYRDSSGNEKYHRREAVELLPEERIAIGFHRDEKGVFISVKDSGVGLEFNKIQNNFQRCYESEGISQIEAKDGGAGLGLYVVFELATHIKIISNSGFGTLTQCWFANPSQFDPDYFSFNYFKGAVKS